MTLKNWYAAQPAIQDEITKSGVKAEEFVQLQINLPVMADMMYKQPVQNWMAFLTISQLVQMSYIH